MIKGLIGEKHVMVTGGDTSIPYISTDSSNPIQGMLRINGANMEVFNGANWIVMNTSYATVELSNAAQKAIDWAQNRMQQERDMELIKSKYPQLIGAIEEAEQAKSKLNLLLALTKEYDVAG